MASTTARRRWVAILLAIGLITFLPSAARGADGDPYVNACLTHLTPAPTGCTTGLTSSPVALAESPDGKQLYAGVWASSGGFYGVQIYDRNPSTGVVTPRTGTGSCFAATGSGASCTLVGSGTIGSIYDISMSPDGKDLYVETTGSMSLLNFSRDANGNLSYVGCHGSGTGCTAFSVVSGTVEGIAVSPDSQNVYVRLGSGLAIFDRVGSALVQKPTTVANPVGCFTETMVAGCSKGVGLAGGSLLAQLTVSPDGAHVYIAFGTPGGVSVFNRFPDGTLTQNVGVTGGCVSSDGSSNGVANQCVNGNDNLANAYTVEESSDNRGVYVGSNSGITSFTVNPQTGTLIDAGGCVGSVAGCTPASGGTSGTWDLHVTEDGSELVASSYISGSLTFFTRNSATGRLTQRAGTHGCFTATGGTCQQLAGLGSGGQVVIDPSGLFVYAAALTNGMLATLARDFAPVCQPATITVAFNTSLPVPFNCSDANGDTMTYSIVAPPNAGALGAIDQGLARVFYNPFSNFTGPDQFQYRASTARATSSPVTVVLNVSGPPPSGGGGSGTVVAASGIDNDHDGFFAGQDCNDNNPNIRPGAVEIKGNNIDENCDGLAEPFPTLTSPVLTRWSVKGSKLTLTALSLSQLPKGWSAQIRCSGSGCKFKKVTLKGKAKSGTADVIKSLKSSQRKFKAKQTVEIWVSAPNFNTKVSRLVLKKGKIPSSTPLCVFPGQTTPQKTCS